MKYRDDLDIKISSYYTHGTIVLYIVIYLLCKLCTVQWLICYIIMSKCMLKNVIRQKKKKKC